MLHKNILDKRLRFIFRYLIQADAEIDPKGGDDSTPLSVAALLGHEDITEYLIKVGADVESKDHFGKTSLYISCENGHLGVTNVLIGHGKANVENPNNEGKIK